MKIQIIVIIITTGITSDYDTVISCRAKLQCHLMLVLMDGQVVFVCKSLWDLKKIKLTTTC